MAHLVSTSVWWLPASSFLGLAGILMLNLSCGLVHGFLRDSSPPAAGIFTSNCLEESKLSSILDHCSFISP